MPPSLFRLAPCNLFQLLLAHHDPETLPQKFGSRQLLGYRLQHRTSPDINGGIRVSVHELLT
jgi:hypothetical protein